MLWDFLNGSREVATRVFALRAGLWLGLIGSDYSYRLVVTLTCLFQLYVVLLAMERLIDLSHIHRHILLRRWVMVLSSCLGLAIAKATFIFFITECFRLAHLSLEAGFIGQSHLWLLPIIQMIGGIMAGGAALLVVVVWLTTSLELYVAHVSDLDVSQWLLSSADLSLGHWTVLFGSGLRRWFGCRDEDVLLLLH